MLRKESDINSMIPTRVWCWSHFTIATLVESRRIRVGIKLGAGFHRFSVFLTESCKSG